MVKYLHDENQICIIILVLVYLEFEANKDIWIIVNLLCATLYATLLSLASDP